MNESHKGIVAKSKICFATVSKFNVGKNDWLSIFRKVEKLSVAFGTWNSGNSD